MSVERPLAASGELPPCAGGPDAVGRVRVVREPLVSSDIVRVTSQPQKMKIDSDSPAAKAEKVGTVSGLNQSSDTAVASNAEPPPTRTNATIANPTSTTSWNPTSQYCTFWVVCMSRYEMTVAPAMKARQVTTLISGFAARSAIDGSENTCPSSR